MINSGHPVRSRRFRTIGSWLRITPTTGSTKSSAPTEPGTVAWATVRTYDYRDPEVQAKLPWGGIDHLARATYDGETGYGIFEHGTIGRHDPSGFDDFMSVAP